MLGHHELGMFVMGDFLPEYAKMTTKRVIETCGGLPYPATILMQRSKYTGPVRIYRADPQVEGKKALVGVCSSCMIRYRAATAFQALDAFRETSFRFCSVPDMRKSPTLNPFRRRLITPMNLYLDPDVSKGPSSVAGRMTGSKNRKVPFDYGPLERVAFPYYFKDPTKERSDPFQCYWHSECEIKLVCYTVSRLYSVCPQFREDPDYVNFSLNRLAAFKQLPEWFMQEYRKTCKIDILLPMDRLPAHYLTLLPAFCDTKIEALYDSSDEGFVHENK